MKRHRTSWVECGFYILSQLTLIIFGVCHARRYAGQRSEVVIDPLVVPYPVRVGSTVQLECHWKVGRKGFNALRWFKDGREIYLYNFGEKAGVDHQVDGVNILLDKSDDTVLTLTNVTPEAQGNYTCEVMTEGPPFVLGRAAKVLTVVEEPETPQILGLDPTYFVGDTLSVTCSAENGLPAPNITLKINGEKAVSTRLTELPPTPGSRPGYFSRITKLQRTIGQELVPTFTLECYASVHGLQVDNVVHVTVNERKSSFYNGFWGNSATASCVESITLVIALIWFHCIC